MRCSKIRELLLTGYTDGELDERTRVQVEAHLRTCEECRRIEETLKNRISGPLRGAERLEPPEYLWSRIKGAIEEDKKENIFGALKERLEGVFIIRRPALALAAISVIVLVTAFFTATTIERSRLNAYLDEQVDFLDWLDNGDGNGNGQEYDDIGIPMEDLFL
jgi:anti-sigma factor RsiW